LGEVVEETPKAGGVAAVGIVHAGSAPVEERHAAARAGQLGAGMFVPASMALDAVHEHQFRPRRARRGVAPIAPAITVAGGELLDRVASCGVTQATPPCARRRAPGRPDRSPPPTPARPGPVPILPSQK